MPLDKIMPDDMNEVACAMLAYISEGDKSAGAKMSYGDFGKHLAQKYGRNYHGCADPNGCTIDGNPSKVQIMTFEGTEYELTWNKVAKFIHPYLKSTAVSETVETNTPTAVTDTPTDTAAFDYSAVDDDTAQYLRKATARIANSYADIGAVLAEAQERLAKHGFGDNNGFFEKWFKSLGMSKMTVYRFIQIHNFRNNMLRSSQFGTNENALEIFDNLPKMLQSDISSPSAPAEAVNAVLSGDITTHKDFIAMKKQLEEVQAENEQLTEKNSTLESRAADLGQQNDLLREQNKKLDDENSFLDAKSCDLEAKVEDLEIELKQEQKKARDVIIPDPKESQEYQKLVREKRELEEKLHKAWGDLNTEEFDRRIAEISQKFSNDAVRQIAADRQASAELLRDRTEAMQARIDELTDKLKELEGRPITGYFLPASIEDYSGICGLLKGTKYEKIMYAAKLIKM